MSGGPFLRFRLVLSGVALGVVLFLLEPLGVPAQLSGSIALVGLAILYWLVCYLLLRNHSYGDILVRSVAALLAALVVLGLAVGLLGLLTTSVLKLLFATAAFIGLVFVDQHRTEFPFALDWRLVRPIGAWALVCGVILVIAYGFSYRAERGTFAQPVALAISRQAGGVLVEVLSAPAGDYEVDAVTRYGQVLPLSQFAVEDGENRRIWLPDRSGKRLMSLRLVSLQDHSVVRTLNLMSAPTPAATPDTIARPAPIPPISGHGKRT
jgi:hypothetical protein